MYDSVSGILRGMLQGVAGCSGVCRMFDLNHGIKGLTTKWGALRLTRNRLPKRHLFTCHIMCSGSRGWSGPTPKALLSSYCSRWASLGLHQAAADSLDPPDLPVPRGSSLVDPEYKFDLEDADEPEGPCTATVCTASALGVMSGLPLPWLEASSGGCMWNMTTGV